MMVLDRIKSYIARLITSDIGRETFVTIGLRVSSVGLVFLSTVLLARILGPADYGIYTYVYALVSLLSVPSEFGLPTLVVRETARGRAQKDHSLVLGVWRWASQMTGAISITLVILSILFILLFKEALVGKRLDTFLWGLVLVPLIALGNLRGAALRGSGRVVSGQLPEFLIRPGLFVVFLAGILWVGKSVFSVSLAMALYVLAAALAFGAGIWLLWRETPVEISRSIPRYKNRAWLLSTLPLALIGGMRLVNAQAAILLQGFFLSDADIGIFRVATQVAALASFGLLSINMVLAPRFATLYAQDNMSQLQRLVTRSAQIILSINLVITVGFVLLGKPFLKIVFGVPYGAAYVPALFLLVGQMINSSVGSVAVLLNMTQRESETAKALVVSAIINIVLNLLLIPQWGIFGSAISTAFSLIVWKTMLWRTVRKELGINTLAFNIRQGDRHD